MTRELSQALLSPVRLRRLEVQGFKSFASRTVFEFGPGVTAIVGPNGSGKSNLTDALRWALGEQHPRALRLRRLEDVIFAGGGKRAQSGLAEVSMSLDNSDGWLPIAFDEVVVTRRLHRSGESEYLINRRKVRLRDILDLFMKARLGQNSYAILGQGMVETVLSLRPEERRLLIEEAADVRRHRLKIDESTDQLSATRDNRDRVELLVAEIAPRLAQLERQARRAAEHGTLSHDLARTLQLLYANRLRSAHEQERSAREQLLAAAAEQGKLFESLQLTEHRLEALRLDVREAVRALEGSESGARHDAEDIRARERSLAELRGRVPVLAKRRAQTERDLEALRQEALALQVAEPQMASAAEAVALAEAAVSSAQEQLRAAGVLAEQTRVEATRAEFEHRRVKQVEAELNARIARLEGDVRRSEQERLKFDQKRLAALGRLKAWARDYRDRLAGLPELEHRLDNARNALMDATRRVRSTATVLGQAERDLLSLDSELLSEQRRLAVLVSERETRRPTEDVVVALLDAVRGGGPGRPRVLGILGGMLHVQTGLEIALEAALSEVLSALVVRSEQEAVAAIAVLREIEAGRLTFFVLEGIKDRHPLHVENEPGILGVASRFVRCDEQYRDLVESLLGRIIIVEDIESARRVVRRGLAAAVTLDGTVLRAGGMLTGGGGKSSGYVFRAAGELEALEGRIKDLQTQQRSSIDRVAMLRKQSEENAAREQALERAQADLDRKMATLEASTVSMRRRFEPLRGELDWMRSAREDVVAKCESAQEALRDAQVLPAAQPGKAPQALAAAAANAEAGAQRSAAEQRVAAARLSEAQGHRAAVLREQTAREALRESSLSARRRTETSIAARLQTLESIERESMEMTRQLDEMAGELVRHRAAAALTLEALEPARQRVRDLQNAERSIQTTLASEQAASARHERVRLDAELAVLRSEQEVQRIQEQVVDEGFPIDLHLQEFARENGDDTQAPLEKLEAKVKSLRARIRALGAVNEEAEADYRESRERHEFLSAQVSDLRDAEQNLMDALEQLRQIVRDQFRATYQTINADFQAYFRTFFGGGQARLVLTEPEDYGESGVDIIAQPPGKRLQNLAMLSGGERSMTAVALLFALLESNPAPFCVLDEVDAALDESNVGRFSDALTKLARRGQFLVVTHNRGTVQSADSIYGISMTGDGISTVLSMRLADATPTLA